MIIIALSGFALTKLHKDKIIGIALDYQSKLDDNTMLVGFRDELKKKNDFEQLRSDFLIYELVNTKLRKKGVSLE